MAQQQHSGMPPWETMPWQTVPELVRYAAERHADAEAVVDGDDRLSFTDLAADVDRVAAAMLAAGVEAGDRVVLWAPNSLRWVSAALGVMSAGAVLVPVSTRLRGPEVADVCARTRASVLITVTEVAGLDPLDMLGRAAGVTAGQGGGQPGGGQQSGGQPGGGQPSGGQQSGGQPGGGRPYADLPHLHTVAVLDDEPRNPALSWPQLLERGTSVSLDRVRARAEAVRGTDVADVIFTSGTTGRPKGVMSVHRQDLAVFDTWSEIVGLREGDRYLAVNPFSHTFGLKSGILACLMRGATLLPVPVFTVDAVLDLIVAERVSVLPGPPTLYHSLLDHPRCEAIAAAPLRLAVTGAAAVPVELVQRMRDQLGFDTVLTAYGLTESTGTVTMCRRGDPPETVARTSGRAIPEVEVRVVGGDGTPLTAGEPGEVLVRGYNVMAGYWEDPEGTAGAIDADGWLRTGDVGVLDDGGNLAITDRVKDMFIVGGFNAYPAEIEHAVGRHPDVSEVAVVGVPDPRQGEVGRAFVVRRAGADIGRDQLRTWCRDQMAAYKVPREIVFIDALPRNALGKVLKHELPTGDVSA